MTLDTPSRRATDHTPRWLLPLLVLLIVLGSGSVVLGVQSAAAPDVARRGDVLEVQELLEQLTRIETELAGDTASHRVRNEEWHACLEQLLIELARTPLERWHTLDSTCPPSLDEET